MTVPSRARGVNIINGKWKVENGKLGKILSKTILREVKGKKS